MDSEQQNLHIWSFHPVEKPLVPIKETFPKLSNSEMLENQHPSSPTQQIFQGKDLPKKKLPIETHCPKKKKDSSNFGISN